MRLEDPSAKSAETDGVSATMEIKPGLSDNPEPFDESGCSPLAVATGQHQNF
jgi:hypothetical protein